MEFAIQAKNISKSFGRLVVLNNIDLQVKPGQRVALLGRNGAGKTTLLRILSTLIEPTTGTIRLSGKDICEEPEFCRSTIGFISHQSFLYDDLTPIQNLQFYARLYNLKNADKRISDLLSTMTLTRWQHIPVRTFSRGMKQRLTIARAFLPDPTLLFLDEPFTGLDQTASKLLVSFIEKLSLEKRTLLLVSHNLEKSLALTDRVIIIEKGKVVFRQATPEMSLKELQAAYDRYAR